MVIWLKPQGYQLLILVGQTFNTLSRYRVCVEYSFLQLVYDSSPVIISKY
jgi:hypothetical protein